MVDSAMLEWWLLGFGDAVLDIRHELSGGIPSIERKDL